MVIRIRCNKLSQHLILSDFYAKGVPNSASLIFCKYFMMLKYNSIHAVVANFFSANDKMGKNDRKWSPE